MNQFEKLQYVNDRLFKQMHHELEMLTKELEEMVGLAMVAHERVITLREKLAARG